MRQYAFHNSVEPDPQRLREARNLLDSDSAAAVKIYHQLASAGSLKSMLALGTLYRRGEGVQRDVKQSEYWYSKASDLGYIPATYGLAVLYLKMGYHRKATMLFKSGAERGFLPATYMLGEMYYRGQGTPQSIEKARELWEWANTKNYLPAKAALGRLLMTGYFGVTPGFRGIWLRLEGFVMLRYLQRKDKWDERLG